jgi:hypothetical protein
MTFKGMQQDRPLHRGVRRVHYLLGVSGQFITGIYRGYELKVITMGSVLVRICESNINVFYFTLKSNFINFPQKGT